MKIRKIGTAIALVMAMLASTVVTAFAYVEDTKTESDVSVNAVPVSVSSDQQPFTPDGTGTVVDDATDQDGKEFYTITTENENVFYLVLDKQREDNNVYFLNAVTEDDLKALAEKKKENVGNESSIPQAGTCICSDKCEEGAVKMGCPVCKNNMAACIADNAEDSDTESTPEAVKEKNMGSMIFVILAVLSAGGAGYYFKVYKPKKDLDDAEDLDDMLGEDDNEEYAEEETVNEDEGYLQEQVEETISDEDDIPDDDYPKGYELDEEIY